jgi:endonuclease-3
MRRATGKKRSPLLSVILARLEKAYSRHDWASRGKCLDVLVASMLTQNTNMANARSGFHQLRRRFRSWNEVMNADISDVQRQIAVCGLARMRARRLQGLLRTIHQQHGKLDLQFVGEMEPSQAYEYLGSFFGIGPKTAACTLLFAFGMPLFPVDKGIHRMARRMQLVRAKAGEAETSRTIQQHLRPRQCYPLHVMMFKHAKSVCRPRNPKCHHCGLCDLCPYGKRRLKHRPPEPEVELATRRMRPVILSRYASDGLAKRAVEDEITASRRTPSRGEGRSR